MLGAVLIAKDAIKEAVADAVPVAPSVLLGVAASELMWTLAAGLPGLVLLESWWFTPRDLPFVRAGLRRCGQPRVVEVWCQVPAELAWARYAARQRHPVHEDRQRLGHGVWSQWTRQATPLGIGPTLRVHTDGRLDVAAIARAVTAALA
jgi:hypothetical protein